MISIKPYLCLRYRKRTNSTKELIRHFNTYEHPIYLKLPYTIQLDYYNKEDTLGKNVENNINNLLGKMDNTIATNNIAKILIRHIP